jgi:hypothetical protein
MATLFITSFFLLGIIILALYRRHNASSTDSEGRALPPPSGHYGGLFDNVNEQAATTESAAGIEAEERRASLLERATRGEREALLEAHASGDRALYEEALDLLLERINGDDKALLSLVSFMMRKEEGMPVSRRLAAALMEQWRRAPARAATAKMLHLVALSDDASLYQRAVELALDFWRTGRIPDLTAEELRTLCDGEFWVLSSQARSSGAGFVLKRSLKRLRRELEKA